MIHLSLPIYRQQSNDAKEASRACETSRRSSKTLMAEMKQESGSLICLSKQSTQVMSIDQAPFGLVRLFARASLQASMQSLR